MNAFWVAFASLTAKERRVIALRVRQRKRLDEAAHALGITLERACELEASAIGKLRERAVMDDALLRALPPG
jgi:DNA-directed RNA polymerase sigma subunit (sigma70/sigma32)